MREDDMTLAARFVGTDGGVTSLDACVDALTPDDWAELFDAASFTRKIESAYARMMETVRRGGSPQGFRVE